ncbi:MAG TPA: 30S ribosomal protein S2 [Patescibacteria group bacterium]|nr:30S ribosomal protein S2 [Patescibacteria group bacterium]
MKNVTLEELLEAGAHFGHQVTRQNPKARDYVFEARDNIHIIDLAKTKEGLDEAAVFVRDLAKKGGTMIVLGAKRQAEPLVREAAKKASDAKVDGLYFVTNRWIGGILTNFGEVSKNFKRLKDLGKFMDTPSEKARFTKKEISLMEKERQKLESFYWGVQDMAQIPDAVFIIDTHLEDLAVREALATGVKTVGITDTNADPTIIDYPIPANDDAVGSVQLILGQMIDAWIEGRGAAAAQTADGKEQSEGKKVSKSIKEDKEEKKIVETALEIDDKAEKTVDAEKELKAAESTSVSAKSKAVSVKSKTTKKEKNA